jgi:hypothetical protein
VVGELIDRIKRACLAIDPDWAEKRYQQAVRTRRVVGSRNPDGTANLGAYQQPVDRIAAAAERIDTLARACKHAGDRRKIDLIRSDLFLGMTDGTYEAMTEDQIIAYVLAHPYAQPGDYDDTGPADGDNGGGEPGDGPSDGKPGNGRGNSGGGGEPGDGHSDDQPDGTAPGNDEPGGSTPGDSEPDDTSGGPDDRPDGGPGGGAPGSPGSRPTGEATASEYPFGDSTAGQPAGDQTASDDQATVDDQAASDGEPAGDSGGLTSDQPAANRCPAPDVPAETPVAGGSAHTGGAAAPAAGRSGTRWAAPEVRIELGTLLGIDEHPGQIPPWGYLPAAHARHLVAGMHPAEWRYLFCDPTGRPTSGGLLRARPTTTSSSNDSGGGGPVRRDPRRGGIVEIAVPASHLARIATAQPPTSPWRPVLIELARHAEHPGRDPNTDNTSTDTDDTDSGDAGRRTPGAALRRWIQLRDRECVHPCCRAPARTTDQDHRIGYAHGGPTTATNLSTPCRHDHRLKDEAGWTMHQPEPGLTIWTSPLGHHYQSRRPPLTPPVPEPYPDDERRLDEPVGHYVWTSTPEPCDCDQPCHCQPQLLPPVPTRKPREESKPTPEPTVIFDPNETFPF